jgi:hypothetical protein
MNMYDLCIILKLTSGDSILCQVLSDQDENILIRDPLQINIITLPTPTSEGIKVTTYYAPWFQGTESRIHMIRKMHILSAAIPDETTKAEYTRIVAERNNEEVPEPTNKKKEVSWLDQLNFKFNSDQDRHKN